MANYLSPPEFQHTADTMTSGSFSDVYRTVEMQIYNDNITHLAQFVQSLAADVNTDIEWRPELSDVLKDIATSGNLQYPWTLVRELWVKKFEMILGDLIKKAGKPLTEDEVNSAKFIILLMRQRKDAPFTMQRLAELVLAGDKVGYKRSGRFIFAVARNVFGIESSMVECIPPGSKRPVLDEATIRVLERQVPHTPPYISTYELSSSATPQPHSRSVRSRRVISKRSHETGRHINRDVSKALTKNSIPNASISGKHLTSCSKTIKKNRVGAGRNTQDRHEQCVGSSGEPRISEDASQCESSLTLLSTVHDCEQFSSSVMDVPANVNDICDDEEYERLMYESNDWQCA